MGGIEYVYWPGTSTRLTPWMLHCLERLDADLQRLFGVRLALDSSHTQRGIRTHQEQVNLFLSRYRAQASGGGPFGDVRWWQGRRYVRHGGEGTVAPPGESNHEIQGTRAAIDVADSGGAGIGTMGSERSNWLRANASTYGLVPEGFSFREAWHYSIPNIFTAVPSGGDDTAKPTPPVPEEDDMKAIIKAGAPNSGIIIQAGVPPYSIPDQTFQALCSVYGITPLEVPDWKYDTVVREQWTAFSTAQAFAANRSLSQADIEKIAATTRAALESKS